MFTPVDDGGSTTGPIFTIIPIPPSSDGGTYRRIPEDPKPICPQEDCDKEGAIRNCYETQITERHAVYPIGGGTKISYSTFFNCEYEKCIDGKWGERVENNDKGCDEICGGK